MKVGQTVNFYDPKKGDRQDAIIGSIDGSGTSLKKILTLEVDDKKVKNVHHADDAEGGDQFWLVKGKESAPRGWAKAKKGEPLVENGPTLKDELEETAEATAPTRE